MLKNKFIGLYLISLVTLFETTAWAVDASPGKRLINAGTLQGFTPVFSIKDVPLPFPISDLVRSDKSEKKDFDKKSSEATVHATNPKPFNIMHIDKNPDLQVLIQNHLSGRLRMGDLTQEQHSNAVSKLAGYYDRGSLEDFLSVVVILSKPPKTKIIISEGKILLEMGLNEVRKPLAYVVDRPEHELFLPVLMNALRILGNNPGKDSGFATDFIIRLCINLAKNEKKEGLLQIAKVPYDEKDGWTKFFNGLSSLATNSLDKSNRSTFLASIETLKGLRMKSRTKPTEVEPTASAKSAPQTADVEPIQNQKRVSDANTAKKTDNIEKTKLASKNQGKNNTAAVATATRADLATPAKKTKAASTKAASDDTSGKTAKPTDGGAADGQEDPPVSAKPTTTAAPTSSESTAAAISTPARPSWADQEVEVREDEEEQEWQDVKIRSRKRQSGYGPSGHRFTSFREEVPLNTTSWRAKAATVSDQRPKSTVNPANAKPISSSSANPAAKIGTSKKGTYAQALSPALGQNEAAKSLPDSMPKPDGRSEKKKPVVDSKHESGSTEPVPPPAPEQPKAPLTPASPAALAPPPHAAIIEDSKALQIQHPQQAGPQPSAAYLNAMEITPEAAKKTQLEHLSLNGDIHAKSTYGRILQMEDNKKDLDLVVRLYLGSAEVPESTRYLIELVESGRVDLNRFSEGRQFLNKHALSVTPAPKTEANPAPTVPAPMRATTPPLSVAQPNAPHPLPPHDGCSPQALAVPQPNIEPIRTVVLPQQTPPTAATPPVPRTFGPGISPEQTQTAAIPPVTQTLPQSVPPQPVLLQTVLPQPRITGYRLPEIPGQLIPMDLDPSEVFFDQPVDTVNGRIVVRIPLIEFVRKTQF